MSYTAYTDINSLDEDSFIGGTDHYFRFSVLDTNGSPLDLNGATITWKMAPYGYPQASVITKTLSDDIYLVGASADGIFEVHTLPEDTLSLSGKHIHQPTIVDYGGEEFTPDQGVITITKKIE